MDLILGGVIHLCKAIRVIAVSKLTCVCEINVVFITVCLDPVKHLLRGEKLLTGYVEIALKILRLGGIVIHSDAESSSLRIGHVNEKTAAFGAGLVAVTVADGTGAVLGVAAADSCLSRVDVGKS